MDIQQASALTSSAVTAAIPLMFAGAGELVAEKSGVLNLGVEGMMLMGAVTGYAVTAITGNPWLGVLAAIGAGSRDVAAVRVSHADHARQPGRHGPLADDLRHRPLGVCRQAVHVGGGARHHRHVDHSGPLEDSGARARAFSALTPLDYLAFAMFAVIGWFLYRTRAGLVLRSVGESPQVAHSVGFPVVGVRYGAVAFGGGMAGLAGGYYSIVNLHLWQEQLTSGRGWIALALVVFATWRPGRLLIGALLFGAVTGLQFYAQAIGVPVPTQFLAMLPYVATVVVLVLISRNPNTIRAECAGIARQAVLLGGLTRRPVSRT